MKVRINGTYTNFAPGQPQKDGFCIQICVVSQSCRPGEWKAVPCVQFSSLFVCEFEQASTAFPTTVFPITSGSTAPPTGFTTCTPPTAPPNVFPCQANILILIDGSGGLTDPQFAQQNVFISRQLLTANWTFTQVAIGEFDDSGSFQAFSPFNSLNSLEDAQAILQGAFRVGDTASITSALQQASTLNLFTGAQPCVNQRTILFTSTSAAADVASATPFATQLKTQGGNLIIIGMGIAINANALTILASPSSYFSWPDYGNVPDILANSIIQAFQC